MSRLTKIINNAIMEINIIKLDKDLSEKFQENADFVINALHTIYFDLEKREHGKKE